MRARLAPRLLAPRLLAPRLLAPRLLAPRLLARPDVRIGSERRVWSATKPIEAALDGPFITAIGLLWRAAKRNVLQGKREKP